MSKMSEVHRLYVEERKYDRSITEEEWLARVAYSKGYQKPKTEDKK